MYISLLSFPYFGGISMIGDATGTRTLYIILVDAQKQPLQNVSGLLTIGYKPQRLQSGEWLVRKQIPAISDADGRMEWEDLPIGANVLIEVDSARIRRPVTIEQGIGDQQY